VAGVLIRLATRDDLELLTRLRIEFIADVRALDLTSLAGEFTDATRAFLDSSLRSGALHSWLAMDGDGDCLGVVAVILQLVPPRPNERREHEGYIINMFVRPSARGGGVARALLEACLAAGPSLDISRFTLHAADAGRPLYEKVGFGVNEAWLELVAPPG
jgi:GNAT superfamily N-acetyltransferase